MKNLNEILNSEILPKVTKPITYLGNELNAVHKEIDEKMIRFAFAFPDIYEVGMSHLGLKILYGLLNDQDDIWCERVFSPWIDMEEEMRKNKLPLYGLESQTPIGQYDFIGFTLQYEMSYTNILNILDLGQIPLESKDRHAHHPFILAGGPCAYNPEPLADFIDLFVIGEAEDLILELMDVYREWKKDGLERQVFLKMAAKLEGIYVPSLYETTYDDETHCIRSFSPISEEGKEKIRKRFIANLDQAYYPSKMIVSYTEVIHDRISMEIFRGCGRGCRFCQAGMIYRPTREKSIDMIKACIDGIIDETGYDEISLSSLSSGDYSQIETLIKDLVDRYEEERIGVALPSLRIDSLSIEMLEQIQKIRKTGLTLAPEAGSQRMRDIINKGVTEKNLIDTVESAFAKGWGHVKLYFMVGLPGEEDADIEGIADLAQKVVNSYLGVDKELRNRSLKLVISTACFVPKAFTPFQWFGQNDQDTFERKQEHLKNTIKDKRISYRWHNSEVSYLEAVFARGDRRLGSVLKRAHQKGCRFDGWHEHFDYEKWLQSFEELGIDPDFYALRERTYDEILPWDFIDIGVTKAYLMKEHQRALEEIKTPYCREACSNCGIMEFKEGWVCNA